MATLGLSTGGLALLAGCGIQGGPSGPFITNAPPETKVIRLALAPTVCLAPSFAAEELLKEEGFTEVQYIRTVGGIPQAKALTANEIDVGQNFAAPLLIPMDAGDPIVILAGVHVGCFELFGSQRVNTISDLKGKSVASLGEGSAPRIFLSAMAAYVGLNPNQDFTWVTGDPAESKARLATGAVDAYLGFPPDPQELRANNIGHVVVNTATTRPWSQYFCCLVSARADFVQKYPAATKRAVRAILKADDLCASKPELAVQASLSKGFVPADKSVYAEQAVQQIPFGTWREYDAEDTLRFYALLLQQIGMIKSSPQKIIERGTDWRILNELKKELKA